MNPLTREIQSCLAELTSGDDGQWVARFVFPPDFTGFRGHFPGRPVLPAVCMVQAVTTALAVRRRCSVKLQRIVSAKWFAPVKPGAELLFTCHERPDETAGIVIRARITSGDVKVADLSLLVVDRGH